MIDIRDLIGKQRKDIILRPVTLTKALEVDGYAVFKAPVDVWVAGADRIMRAYTVAHSRMITDDSPEEIANQVSQLSQAAIGVTIASPINAWIERVNAKHAEKFVSAVKAVTKYDVSPFLALHREEIEAFQKWAGSLIVNISDEIERKINAAVMDGILSGKSPNIVQREINEILSGARSRARLIASDQANKIHAKMQELRAKDVGIKEYIWRTAGDERVRMTHATANGKKYTWDKPPSEIGRHPGEPIRCRCSAQAYIPLLDEV